MAVPGRVSHVRGSNCAAMREEVPAKVREMTWSSRRPDTAVDFSLSPFCR